jgi:hypothetical protein
MDIKFYLIGFKAVFSDTTRNGLFIQFNRQYKKRFGKNVTFSCPKCKAKAWDDYLKTLKPTKMANSNYILKNKYNGIQLGFGGKPMRNGEFTDAEAKKLIKSHSLGEALFSKLPEKVIKKPTAKKTTKKTAKPKK